MNAPSSEEIEAALEAVLREGGRCGEKHYSVLAAHLSRLREEAAFRDAAMRLCAEFGAPPSEVDHPCQCGHEWLDHGAAGQKAGEGPCTNAGCECGSFESGDSFFTMLRRYRALEEPRDG